MESDFSQSPDIIFWLILIISSVMIVVVVFILPHKVRKEQREFDRAREEAAEEAQKGVNEESNAATENAGSEKPGTDDS